jgi:hypothetical protein
VRHATDTPSVVNSENAFFDPHLGTDGQACATCYQPDQAFSIVVPFIRDQFEDDALVVPPTQRHEICDRMATCSGTDGTASILCGSKSRQRRRPCCSALRSAPRQADSIASFMTDVFTAQDVDFRAGSLSPQAGSMMSSRNTMCTGSRMSGEPRSTGKTVRPAIGTCTANKNDIALRRLSKIDARDERLGRSR